MTLRPYSKFIVKSLLLSFPFLFALTCYVIRDPFMVLRQYDDYDHSPICQNEGYVAWQKYKLYRHKAHYDAFLMGNSCTKAFSCDTWNSYVHGHLFRLFCNNLGLADLCQVLDALDRQPHQPVRHILLVTDRGRIGIFNRSHYEDVFVARVHPEIVVNAQIPGIKDLKDVDEKFWEKRYRQINDFERYLSETGTTVIKFFLNVSKDEQRKRLLKRIDDKEKNWKFEAGDLKERAAWDQYMDAYSKMLTKTSTDYAPWYVIPADHKWFMRYAVGQIINHRLEELKMSYPKLDKEAEAGLKACKEQLLNEEKDTKAGK